jgi:hypothetical protein
MIFRYHLLGFSIFSQSWFVLSSIPDMFGNRSGIFGRVRYAYRTCSVSGSVLLTVLSSTVISSTVCAFELRFTFCLLRWTSRFHRPYLGALVTSWLGYPRFETLLLFYRSGVSRFLVFWFGALSIFGLLVLWWSAVFQGNIHPSLRLWSSRCLCLLLGGLSLR